MEIRATDERKYIEVIIGEELKGTPLEGTETLFVEYGGEYRVDPLLAVAISYHESKYCKAYTGWYNSQYHNCSGIMDGGQKNGLVTYRNWEEFIKDYFRLLADYIYRDGRNTISEIGSKYAPISSHQLNGNWNGAVSRKYKELWKRLGQ